MNFTKNPVATSLVRSPHTSPAFGLLSPLAGFNCPQLISELGMAVLVGFSITSSGFSFDASFELVQERQKIKAKNRCCMRVMFLDNKRWILVFITNRLLCKIYS